MCDRYTEPTRERALSDRREAVNFQANIDAAFGGGGGGGGKLVDMEQGERKERKAIASVDLIARARTLFRSRHS